MSGFGAATGGDVTTITSGCAGALVGARILGVTMVGANVATMFHPKLALAPL